MSMSEAIASVFKNYVNFNGRARRKEFWYFALFDIIITAMSFFIIVIFPPMGLTCLFIWKAATLLPMLGVTWRRLHDTGRGGAWYLLSLTGFGMILLIIFYCEDSVPGENVYGPNPKGHSQNNNRRRYDPVNPQPTALAVQCLSGPLQGQTYRIGQNLTFGTDVSSGVRFPVGTPGVSRNHCRIFWQNGELLIVDVGSTFGTFVAGGKKLPVQYPERISQGTTFCLGGQGETFQVILSQM